MDSATVADESVITKATREAWKDTCGSTPELKATWAESVTVVGAADAGCEWATENDYTYAKNVVTAWYG